jgi:hypothetical protein
MNEIEREASGDREYEFVCDVCKRELYVMPTYDHDQIDGEEWFHKDDSTVACDAWEVAPDLYEEVQTVRAQLAALRAELRRQLEGADRHILQLQSRLITEGGEDA